MPELGYLPLVYVAFGVLALATGILRGKNSSVITWSVFILMMVGIVGAIYWFLVGFSQTIDPGAPYKIERVPIPILGSDTAGTYRLRAFFGLGFYLPLIAALIQVPASFVSRVARIRRKVILAPLILLFLLLPLSNGIIGEVVAQKSNSQSLQDLVDATPRGGTLTLGAGTYFGPATISKPISIEGLGYPLVSGRGEGDVISILANDVSIRGLRISGSSPDISKESAGIKILGNNSRIVENMIEDTLFSVYLQGVRGTVVERNRMVGFLSRDANDRGHGVYLWYSFDSTIVGNNITRVKDGVYGDHSYDFRIEGNSISDSRYGVHVMYCAGIKIVGNFIRHNLVGMTLMFSNDLHVSRNTVAENRGVAVSEGVFVRESGGIRLEENMIYGHMRGLILESSPYPVDSEQVLVRNTIAFNHIGIEIDSNSGGLIQGNNFVENSEQVKVTGSSIPRISWEGNFWSDYRGAGDIPYKVENSVQDLLERLPQLSVFTHSPAYISLELFKKTLPIVPTTKVVDDSPSVKPLENIPVGGRSRDFTWLLVAMLLTFTPTALLVTIARRP